MIDQGRVSKVHADTHLEPLKIAMAALDSGAAGDPFMQEHAKEGRCRVLRDDLRRQYRSPYKHLYIKEL